jgi:hypothetical protein
MPDRRDPVVKPIADPEPRKRITGDPVQIFRNAIASSEADRKLAAHALDMDVLAEYPPSDARLLLVNLDADDEREIIYLLSESTGTVALIFDHQADGWWEVGRFGYRWHWDPNKAERFVELREILPYGGKDILVRDMSGGTGASGTQLSIYRLLNGRLYRIFETEEESWGYVYGAAKTVSQRSIIDYPTDDTKGERFLVVRRVERTEPDEPTKAYPVTENTSCSPFRWNADRFAFVRDETGGRRLCRSSNLR